MLIISNDMEEIVSQENAIVYFTAEWCNPCKQLKPHYGKVAVIDAETNYYLVDVDQIPMQYLEKFGIKSVPQIFEMNNGAIVRKIEGKTSDAILSELGKIV
jgi:thioredoxin 1